MTPSALWNSTTDGSGQVRSWGLSAMGLTGGVPSNGSATVYVLDTGVDVNADLNVTSRMAAFPGINPIGCYQHSTHVAGIIGARDNSYGVVGALPGVEIVSIAIGDHNTGNCSDNPSAGGLTNALDQVYAMVLYSGKVGIVNLSFNANGSIFSSTSTVGQKMIAVASPSFSEGGYKGTLIVQSAGNDYQDACIHSYNSPSANDGIMVVGGLDANGQAVRPFDYLGGLPGFISLPLAGDEPGSNFGGCVEVWAPSERIKSTWGGGFEFLSGTSMAAPHIAGFAARLLEGDPSINSSVALESAVRSFTSYISGSNLAFASFISPVTANPTIELVEGDAPSLMRTGASPTNTINFTKFDDVINLRYQAFGTRAAQSCLVYGTLNNSVYLYQYLPPTYTFPLLAPGQYHWDITCYSPQGTTTTVFANATVQPSVHPT